MTGDHGELCECSWSGPLIPRRVRLTAAGERRRAAVPRGGLHDAATHAGGRGRCLGLDSYGIPCTCPSFVRMEP